MNSEHRSTDLQRQAALEIFLAGVQAADPHRAVHESLRIAPGGRPVIAGQELVDGADLRIVAFGKASISMVEATLELLPPERFPGPGIIAVNPENHRQVDRFRVFASSHPVPDKVGVAAAGAVEDYLQGGREEDAVLILISGGGSALLPAPAPGISLEDKMDTTRLLLASGAPIQEINAVRKHLSVLKGGGMARLASPSRVESLILSDVIGDDLSSIASGPTAPDPTTFEDVAAILGRYSLTTEVPGAVRRRVEQGVRGEIADTPSEGDPVFDRVINRLVGTNSRSLEAAGQRAAEMGFQTLVLTEPLLGEARGAPAVFQEALLRHGHQNQPLAILAGGETTVTLRGKGRGGRNQEMALAFALHAESAPPSGSWVFLSGGTDGRDGPTDAAGGMVDAGTATRVRAAGLDPTAELDDNNSHAALSAAGDLLQTGSTGTNVADLQVLLIYPGSSS